MEKIKSYKGFDKNLSCRGFQYEVGKTYEMPEEDVEVCEMGFHACESPLEVLDYYFFDDNCEIARFCEVEQSGKIDKREDGSTKVASSRIEIKAELKFADLIRLGIEWIKDSVTKVGGNKENLNDNSRSAQIGSSGDSAQIGSSGDCAQINSSGEDSVICCAGHRGKVKAKKGSWVTLSEWKYDNDKDRYIPLKVVTFQIDGEEYKEGRWYTLRGGKVIDVTEG